MTPMSDAGKGKHLLVNSNHSFVLPHGNQVHAAKAAGNAAMRLRFAAADEAKALNIAGDILPTAFSVRITR